MRPIISTPPTNSSGYYRVNYDARNWGLLATYLLRSPPQDMLSAVTRAQLLDDALNLARAGTLSYEVALNMTRYLAARESHYVPWKAVFENMRFLDFMLRQTPAYGVFQVPGAQPTSL
jgi:aminopeptidase N